MSLFTSIFKRVDMINQMQHLSSVWHVLVTNAAPLLFPEQSSILISVHIPAYRAKRLNRCGSIETKSYFNVHYLRQYLYSIKNPYFPIYDFRIVRAKFGTRE